jgi:hypothetical protein
MPTGRCFRDRRKTARRKDRQVAALVEFKRHAPGARIWTRFGGHISIELTYLDQQAKQKLVEGYERALAAGGLPRPARAWR